MTSFSDIIGSVWEELPRAALARWASVFLSVSVLTFLISLAAKRAGVGEILLPSDNEPNVHEDLGNEMLEGLKLSYVKTIQDVVDHALEKEPVPVGAGRRAGSVTLTPAATGPPN